MTESGASRGSSGRTIGRGVNLRRRSKNILWPRLKASRWAGEWYTRILGSHGGDRVPENGEELIDNRNFTINSIKYNAPPIEPFKKTCPNARRIIVLTLGLQSAELERIANMLSFQQAERMVVPICIIDTDHFDIMRNASLIFEYMPPKWIREQFESDLDWDMYDLRKLWLMRQKWQPSRIVGFGQESATMMKRWMESPYEDYSIRLLLTGTEDSYT